MTGVGMVQQESVVAEQPMGDILAQLAALTTLVQQQGAVMQLQGEEIARLKAVPPVVVPIPPTPSRAPVRAVADTTSAKVRRRGLLGKIAGATAAAALLTVAKEASTAEAAARGTILTGTGSTSKYGLLAVPNFSGNTDPTPYLVGVNGTRYGVIGAIGDAQLLPVSSNAGVLGLGGFSSGSGVIGVSYQDHGVFGQSLSGAGVRGDTSGSTGVGVWGRSVSTANGAKGIKGEATGSTGETYGVFGETASGTANAAGVLGKTSSGTTYGVWGQTLSTANSAIGVFGQAAGATGTTYGVWGRSQSSSASAIGVYGHVTAANAPGTGVMGYSVSGSGVQGVSTSGIGVRGQSSSNNGVAAIGLGAASALLAWNTGTGRAAEFIGPVTVQGAFTVTGGPKSAAVKRKDGSYARMYCQESPEPWFEDFGTAEVKNGQAGVALDPEFDEVVKGDDYRVFLTEIGDCGGLYVSRKGPHRFEVKSRGGASASGSFDYRVVARRADPVGKRLEKVDVSDAARIKDAVKDVVRPTDPPPAQGE